MKKLLFLLILIIILFTQPVLADNNLEMSTDIKVFVNGVKKDFNTPAIHLIYMGTQETGQCRAKYNRKSYCEFN